MANKNKWFYAQDNAFSKEVNALPEQYKNKIICADSLEILKQLPDNCIDIILTSPPYNFGMSYDTYDDTSQWEEYFTMLFNIFTECIRVLKWGGENNREYQSLIQRLCADTSHINLFLYVQKDDLA